MNEQLEKLNDILQQIETMWKDAFEITKETFKESNGNDFPFLNYNDLATIAAETASVIKNTPTSLSKSQELRIDRVYQALNHLRDDSVRPLINRPNLRKEQYHQKLMNYLAIMNWAKNEISFLATWDFISGQPTFPAPQDILDEANSYSSQLKQISEVLENLSEKVNNIDEANKKSSEFLNLWDKFSSGIDEVDKVSVDVDLKNKSIEEYLHNIKSEYETISGKQARANEIILKCQEAYKISTTTGLAGAFTEKAKFLNYTIIALFVLLVLALGAGVWIGTERYKMLNKLLEGGQTQWGVILLNIVLSVLSLGAPIWLAWITTKQISQRFRLAEDYSFKATIAKAYEGYKSEAISIDSELSKKLFISALSHFDESPLRFEDIPHHGSPWEELSKSKEFKDFFSSPGIVEKFMHFIQQNSPKKDG